MNGLLRENSRPVLLFLHGAGLNAAMWQPQIERLGEAFDILAIDLPGHGRNKYMTFSLASAVECIAGQLTHKRIGKAIIIGLSLGGYVAMAFAEKYPRQVAGMVLSGSSIRYSGIIGFIARINALLSGWMPERLFNHVQKRMLCAAGGIRVYEEMQQAGLSKSGAREGTLSVIGFDFLPGLQKLGVPLLLLNGEYDSLNKRYADRILSSAGEVSVATLAECGHLCNLEKADAFTERIRQFSKVCISRG